MKYFLITPFIIYNLWGLMAQSSEVFQPIDVFDIEYVSDPQISPDGVHILFVRNFKDIMTDANLSNLWLVDDNGANLRPVTTGNQRDYSPRWSPDGTQIIYLSNKDGKPQIYQKWMENGQESKLTNLTKSPRNIQWSPDGTTISFVMSVEAEPKNTIARMPSKPKGAKWADAPRVIEKMNYKADGVGFTPDAYSQIFTLPIYGGSPRQITFGEYNNGGAYSWDPNSSTILFSANRRTDAAFDPRNSEVQEVDLITLEVKTLTDRQGPDNGAKISPNGQLIAYTGFDDTYQGYTVTKLYVMNRDGSDPKLVSGDLDRDVANIFWSADSKSIYFQYDDQGNTKVANIDLNGQVKDIAKNVGGLSLGRPYSGGTFSVARNGIIAFTHSTPDHPADLAVVKPGDKEVKRLTNFNADLFANDGEATEGYKGLKKLGEVEEIWFESTFDKRKVQGWICKPPNFDPNKKYPLLLEIHGGPFTNYGSRFSAEVQMYAAAGYVVLYTNPRGSTSYGQEFGNLIHHNYPGQDYDDLMSGVDAVIAKGYIDENQLYITGGSGGGVLTAWTIGNTDRFKAAVVAKPVINWYSFVLHADGIPFFYKYWFPDFPWNAPEHYMKRSPISLVGNVKTPTMLLTGEQDYRTPMSETEQYYAALKLRKIPSAMVRIQGAGHGIAAKPSNLIAKVSYILGWFEKYNQP